MPPSPGQSLSTCIARLSIETLQQEPTRQTPPTMALALASSPYTHCTIANPITFSAWLDEIGAQNINSIQHLHLHPSPHLGRIISLPLLGDEIGDSLGDHQTLAELHAWIEVLHRLAHVAMGLRSISVFFAADVSGMDTHRYRRGVGECLAFLWAIGKFVGLEYVDLGGYFPLQWPYYLMALWGGRTRLYNSEPAPEYLLWEWRQGTQGLNPSMFGWR